VKDNYSDVLDDFDVRHSREDAIHNYHDTLRHEMILKEILPIKDGEVILDAGCGSGDLFVKIAAHCSKHNQLYGIDVSKPNILKVKEKLVGNKNAEVMAADIKSLSCFGNSTFDKIVCSEVLEHIEEIGAAVSEIKRVCKKGGKVVITVPNLWHPGNYIPCGDFHWTRLKRRYILRDFLNGFSNKPYKASDGSIMECHYYYSPRYFSRGISKYFTVEKLCSTLKWSNRPIYGVIPNLQERIAFSRLCKANFWPLKYLGIQLFLVCRKD